MATSIYIFKLKHFSNEELEDIPYAYFKLNGVDYGIILCDEDFWGDDNLVDVLEYSMDNDTAKKIAKKLKQKAIHISYL